MERPLPLPRGEDAELLGRPRGKLYHCFGCGKGGDLITFVQETEGLDFVQAIEWLADRYRITLEYEETSPQDEARRARRERLLALLEQAARFYERYLWEADAGESVRAYLTERGLQEEVCREFRLGLSPGGVVLAQKAQGEGLLQDELVAAGLVNRRGNDYFAGRLVFPLADARGRVLGFGARRLRDDDPIPAKYVNSPEGEVFRKGSIVYGLDRARSAVAKEERALVVEGYTDVLALHQAGLHSVVASMGTALTEPQLKELRRLARHLYLCFDSDAAGEAATLRGMELAVKAGFEVRVVPAPGRARPRRCGRGLRGARRRLGRLPAPPGRHRARQRPRQEAFEHVEKLIAAAPPGPEREEVARYASDRLGVPIRIAAGSATVVRQVSPKLLDAGTRLERRLLAACTTSPDLVERYLRPLDDRHFDSDLHRRLRAHLVDGGEADGDLVAAVAELRATAAADQLEEESARELFFRLEERLVQRELDEEAKGGDTKRVMELQQLLRRIREAIEEGATELR